MTTQSTNGKTDVFIFDIDGTLASHKGIRSPYEEYKVHLDLPIDPVWKVLRALSYDYQIIFVSGRTDSCKQKTLDWLEDHFDKDLAMQHKQGKIKLFMRKTGDQRKDSIVKKEIYDEHIFPYYNIVGVFDDRLQVCRMLYENNIFCFNVNQGLIEF